MPSLELCLLSLDGGGVRGLSSLLILKRIMEGIDPASPPKPCDVFDMIGGTSTGGLIAIMLGRLRMTVDECIDAYITLSSHIFQRSTLVPVGWRGQLRGRFSADRLGEEIREVVSRYGLDQDGHALPGDALFRDDVGARCKVFVCATRREMNRTVRLTSFRDQRGLSHLYETAQIWQVARATSAATSFFDPMTIGTETFTDGGTGANNPVREMWVAAMDQWPAQEHGPLKDNIKCLLSIGTGRPNLEAFHDNISGIRKTLQDLATDTDRTAKLFAQEHTDMDDEARYFRFDVDRGLQDIGLEEYEKVGAMMAATGEYVTEDHVHKRLKLCAANLAEKEKPLIFRVPAHSQRRVLRHETCLHHLERVKFTKALKDFFETAGEDESRKFVLWGLGGAGKTQIALHYARSIKRKYTHVFWVQADKLETFLGDYQQILVLLSNSHAGTGNSLSPKQILSETRQRLEQTSSDWFLVIDNADTLDLFLKESADGLKLRDYLPSRGKILITTRTSRWLGKLVAASDGMEVREMEAKEAAELLLKSVPQHLQTSDEKINRAKAEDLVDQLGNLPLAIAQAAANIDVCSLTLSRYAELYEERKNRMELLEETVVDPNDPDAPPQSVLVTWTISIEHIRAVSPVSFQALCLMAFLHWNEIPGALLRLLPELSEMDDIAFAKTMAPLLHMSLIHQDVRYESGFTYEIHPLVHHWISYQLAEDDRSRHLTDIVNVVAFIFPITGRHDFRRFLLSHVLQLITHGEHEGLVSKAFVRLLQVVAVFLQDLGINEWALELISKSLDMALEVWDATDISIAYIHKYKARCLQDCDQHHKAETEFRAALRVLESSTAAEMEKCSTRIDILPSLASTAKILGLNDEAKSLDEQMLAETYKEIGDQDDGLTDRTYRHNFANNLKNHGKVTEAEAITDENLRWFRDHQMEENPTYLKVLNLKAHCLRMQDHKEQALPIYLNVFYQTMEIQGPTDVDTWIAAVNVCGTALNIRLYEAIQTAMVHLFSKIDWTVLQGRRLVKASYILNVLGVIYQRKGLYWEAETLHTNALKGFHAKYSSISNERSAVSSSVALDNAIEFTDQTTIDAVYYNICLAISRGGKLDEGRSYRQQHLEEVTRAEAEFGTIEVRLVRDTQDKTFYEEAKERLQSGPVMRVSDPWWIEHKDALERGEDRYGPLQEDGQAEPSLEGHGAASSRGPDVPSSLIELFSSLSIFDTAIDRDEAADAVDIDSPPTADVREKGKAVDRGEAAEAADIYNPPTADIMGKGKAVEGKTSKRVWLRRKLFSSKESTSRP